MKTLRFKTNINCSNCLAKVTPSLWIFRSILTPHSGHTDPPGNQGKQIHFNCHSGGY